jgi:NAD(P)-dependent dehydrogenase (short-subunit alcohol dehydrogenase family)
MEMQLDGQFGAFFHILHGGPSGYGQIEFNAPGVDIRQWFGVAGESLYGPTKAALDGLAPSWAIQLAGRQITDNIERDGPIETPMLADPVSNAIAPKLASLGRFVLSEEAADLVAFLHGRSGCSVAGQRLIICWGASL